MLDSQIFVKCVYRKTGGGGYNKMKKKGERERKKMEVRCIKKMQ